MKNEYKGVKDFRDLEVWQHCRKLRQDIETGCKLFPPEEKFRLNDQLVRAARSVTANFAEGHGRYHFKESIQQLRIARGSLYEVLDHMIVATDNAYLCGKQFKEFEGRIETGLKLLNGTVRYLKSRKESDGKLQSTGQPVSQ